MAITSFSGQYRFLSNFYLSTFILDNNRWISVEHYYQASKCDHMFDYLKIRDAATPSEAKKLGRKVKLIDGWDTEIKLKSMEKALRAKFENAELRQKLVDTYPEKLVEGNYWHDNFWGDCTCDKCKRIWGYNCLGRLLMKIRAEYRI